MSNQAASQPDNKDAQATKLGANSMKVPVSGPKSETSTPSSITGKRASRPLTPDGRPASSTRTPTIPQASTTGASSSSQSVASPTSSYKRRRTDQPRPAHVPPVQQAQTYAASAQAAQAAQIHHPQILPPRAPPFQVQSQQLYAQRAGPSYGLRVPILEMGQTSQENVFHSSSGNLNVFEVPSNLRRTKPSQSQVPWVISNNGPSENAFGQIVEKGTKDSSRKEGHEDEKEKEKGIGKV